MQDAQQNLIDLSELSYATEGMQILSDITLRANEARLGIVGRNGSGKTTLARMMAGLSHPTHGLVRIDGAAVARDRKAALSRVGILFQNPDHQILFPTVEEEIAFGLEQMGMQPQAVRETVAETLHRFGKAHWATAAVHHLSQGQRQLVCLMAILAMAPKVIILDEPFSGLDIPTTRQLERLLDSLPQTLVQITHDPAALRGYDRVLWLEGGKLQADGPPQTVLPAFTAAMTRLGEGDDISDLAG